MPDLGPKSGENLVSLNLTAQRVKWLVSDKDGWATAWPYLWHGEVLASDKGHLYAYRQSDGSLAWSHDFPGQFVRGIGVTPDMLYLGTMHGMIYAFSPPKQP
ncbi:MAG: PQQ-binding-like beta-propeller repeat protein [Candidatus Acidiferrales bacterium]